MASGTIEMNTTYLQNLQQDSGEAKIVLPHYIDRSKNMRLDENWLFLIDGSGSMGNMPQRIIVSNLSEFISSSGYKKYTLCDFGNNNDLKASSYMHTNIDTFSTHYMKQACATYTNYIKYALDTSNNITHLVFHGDGSFSDGMMIVTHIKNAALQGKLNKLTDLYLTFAYHTAGYVVDNLTQQLLEVMNLCPNAIKVTPFLFKRDGGKLQLKTLIESNKSGFIINAPEGFIRIGDLFAIEPTISAEELLPILTKNELITKVRDFMLNTIKINPSILISHRVYQLLHKVLLSFYQDDKTEYLDKISVIKAGLSGSNAIQATQLLNSVRDDAETSDKLMKLLIVNTNWFMILPPIDSVSKQDMIDAIKDGSGYHIISIIMKLFRNNAPPKIISLDEAKDSNQTGMPVSSTFTSVEILKALSLMFHSLFPTIIISRQQVFLCIMKILTLDINLPVEFLNMLQKVFADPKVIQEMFGMNSVGKLEMNDKWFSPIIAQVYSDSLNQHQNIILEHCNDAIKCEIIKKFTLIDTLNQKYNSLKQVITSVTEKFKGRNVNVSFMTTGSFQIRVGSIVLCKPFNGEPWMNVPLIGLVLEISGDSVWILQLDQENFMHNLGSAHNHNGNLYTFAGTSDTHNVKRKNVTPISDVFFELSQSRSLFNSSNTEKVNSIENERIDPESISHIIYFLPETHPIKLINRYLIDLKKQDGKFSEDAPYEPSIRSSEEAKIMGMSSTSKVTQEQITVTLNVGELISFLVAHIGLPSKMDKMIRCGEPMNLANTTLLMEHMTQGQKHPMPTISVVYKSVRVTLDPYDDMVFGLYLQKLKGLLSKTRSLSCPKPLSIVYCPCCIDDVPIEEAHWTSCHHFICKSCKTEMDSHVHPPTPGAIIDNCSTCLVCMKQQDTPYEPLTRFFETNGAIQPGTAAMWCNDCCKAFVQPLPCGGDLDNLGKLCDSCKPLEHIADAKYCPGCPKEISKNFPMFEKDGCDHMTCEQCHTHFCWGCLYVFNDTQSPPIESIWWKCLRDCDEDGVDSYLDSYGGANDGYDSY
jgi:hypothetical protein